MIIAQVLKTFGGGGAQRAAVNLAQGLAERGQRSRLLALGAAGSFAEQVSGVLPCDAMHLPANARAIASVGVLRRLIQERGIQVLHVHGSGTLPLIVAAGLLGGRRGPSIHFTWHDSGTVLGGGIARVRLLRWALDRCDSVSAPSCQIAERLGSSWRPGRVAILPNGVPDPGPLADPGAETPSVVWASRLVPDKRPEWFLQAAAAARHSQVRARFILAGGAHPRHAEYAAELRALATALGSPAEVPGWVEDPRVIYAGASIACQTSKTEGLSLALLEQMMAGLAVVATNVGDTARALGEGQAGVLVDPHREQDFREALAALLRDRPRRIALGQRARARALQSHTCVAMADAALRLYSESSD
jgi:glycosyltransferase involved in cell wall biosynthesis